MYSEKSEREQLETRFDSVLKIIINAAIFQVGWILCVLYGNTAAVPVALFALAVFLLFYRRNFRDIALLVFVVTMGWIGDALLGLSGVLLYPTNAFYPPFWLMTLWLLFATSLTVSLEWIVSRKWGFLVFAIVGGSLSYVIGVRLSLVTYGFEALPVIAALVISWTVYGLIIPRLYQWWNQGVSR